MKSNFCLITAISTIFLTSLFGCDKMQKPLQLNEQSTNFKFIDGKYDNGLLAYRILDDNNVSVSSGEFIDEVKQVNVPSSIEIQNKYYTISVIEDGAFVGCSNLEKINLPNTISSVGSYCFEGCTSLSYNQYLGCNYLGTDENPYFLIVKPFDYSITEFILHDDTKLINNYCFEDCSIDKLSIPDGIIYVDIYSNFQYINHELYNFQNITTVYEEGYYLGNENNPYVVFFGFYNLDNTCKKLVIHENTRIIPKGIDFINGSDLLSPPQLQIKTFEILSSSLIVHALPHSFYLVENIILPENGVTINGIKFDKLKFAEYDNCNYLGNDENPYLILISQRLNSNLVEINVHDDTKIIGPRAFYGNPALEKINFSNKGNLKYIEANYYNYSYYNSIEELSIPASVIYFGIIEFDWLSLEFENNSSCTSLTSYIYTDKHNTIEVEIPDSFVIIDRYSYIETKIIPSNIKYIGTLGVFNKADRIYISDEITIMDERAISRAMIYSSLKEKPDGWDENWNERSTIVWGTYFKDNFIFDISGENINILLYVGSESEITIPYMIEINETSYSVTTIGEYAFSRCSSLTSFTIPNGVTSIGGYAFSGCSSLESIVIPNSVTSIGYNAFNSCDFLTIYCEATSQPSGWDSRWNPSNKPVYWGVNTFIMGIEQNGIQYSIINGEAVVIKYVGTDTSVVIPSTIEVEGVNYNVTTIGESAFSGCSALTSIEIPDSVTTIGDYAFQNCSSLYNINIPCGVKNLSVNIFSGCLVYNLKYEIVDDQVKILGYNSIDKNVIIPDTIDGYPVTSIEDGTFYNLNIISVALPNTIKHIGEYAFMYCDVLQYNEYDNAYYLGNDENPYLVLIKAKDTTITSCQINENTKTIASNAFSNCNSLTSFTIPNGVTSIGDRAFSGCKSLTGDIFIPNTVENMGCEVFSSSSSSDSLAFIYCEATSKPSGWDSTWCGFLLPVYWGVTQDDIIEQNGIRYLIINGEAVVIKYVGTDTSVVIPCTIEIKGVSYTVTTISEFAFQRGSSLRSIVIPNNVTTIEAYAFVDINSLTIYCEATSQPSGWDSYWNAYSSIRVYWGVTQENLIEQNGIQYLIINGESIVTKYVGTATEVVIPSTIEVEGVSYNVTTIGERAFSRCSSLTSIVIPNSVTTIGEYAFYNCSSLETITIEEDSQLTTIGEYAFDSCSSLANLVIPNSVTTIGEGAFIFCDSLTSIVIPDNVTTIAEGAFAFCDSLIIYCGATSQPSGWDANWNEYGGIVVYYYSESEPQIEGNYWHYDDNGENIIIW